MILVTVGAQMPFDRLVCAVDEWACRRGRDDVFAQIGPSSLRPGHIRWVQFMNPAEFREKVRAAQLIVAHAGMGTIITALEIGTPILVMPRRGDFGETRNDHQVATAKRFLELRRVSVAMNEDELARCLDRPIAKAGMPIASVASEQLLTTLRCFIQQD